MVLAVSLWTADDMSWLDNGCADWLSRGIPKCNLETAAVTLSNVRTADIPSPPLPPPSQPPAVPSPPPPSYLPPPPATMVALSSSGPSAQPFVALFALGAIAYIGAKALRRRASSARAHDGNAALPLPPAAAESHGIGEDDEEGGLLTSGPSAGKHKAKPKPTPKPKPKSKRKDQGGQRL